MFAILQQDWCMFSLCHTGLLLEMQMRGSCHPSSCAVPPSPINKTIPCKGRWFSWASVTWTQQCCISACLVLFYLCWYLQCFVKYKYLGFVVCFNSQISASSSKLSLRFFKSFAWGREQIASGHIPCYFSQGSIWKSFILWKFFVNVVLSTCLEVIVQFSSACSIVKHGILWHGMLKEEGTRGVV